MTTDDILRMAREAGFDFDTPTKYEHAALLNRAKHDLPAFERFAALVAAAEREQCAKVCKDEMIDEEQCNDDVAYNAGCFDCAAAIRARGTK